MLLLRTLSSELATIKMDLKGFCEAAELKSKHAGFALWKHITEDELSELISGTPFAPRAFAENLVLRHYSLTSRESLKKDRQKLRKHQNVPVQREMESGRSPLTSIPPFGRGFSRHQGLPIRCVFGKSAKDDLPRLSNIVSMSPPSYPSAWLHPCRARFRFARQSHCNSGRRRGPGRAYDLESVGWKLRHIQDGGKPFYGER
jgi:hypothetical protein